MRSWRYRSRNMPRNYTIAASFITPTALLMVQTGEASPVWPMLLARTAETVIGARGCAAGPLEQLLSDANSALPPRPYLLSPVEMFQTSPNLSSTTPKCAPHGAFANGIVTLPPPRVSFAMSCSPSSVDSTPAVKPKKRRAPACWSCPAGRRRRA